MRRMTASMMKGHVDDGEEGALDISCNEGGEDGEDDIELYCWFCTFVVEC
jgi:hypothetical protein